MELQKINGFALLGVVLCVILLIWYEYTGRTWSCCVWAVLEEESCLLDALGKFTNSLEESS